MFERFIWFKQSKGLGPRTTEEYHFNFRWLRDYLEQDLSREEMTLEVFNEWIDFMIIEKVLQPTTVKIHLRKMRAFLRWYFLEGKYDI
jgi:integrase/recombinase XerD